MTSFADGGYRYRALDAWRGVCALLVAFVHVPVAHAWQPSAAFQNMQLFVDFFFVLSGFVICHAYGDRLWTGRNWQGFMIRRLGRVYPLHFVVLAGFVALELLKVAVGFVRPVPLDGVPFTGYRSIETLISNLLLTQSFNLHGFTSWNGPAWSIGVEFYSYCVFAIAALVAGRSSVSFAGLAVLGLACVAVLSPTWLFTTHDFGFWRCLYGFFLGCLVCNAVDSPKLTAFVKRFAPSSTRVEVAAVAVLVCFLAMTGPNVTSLAAPLVFAGIVFVFAFERGAISRLLLTAPAQALGLWSYSIYMVHMLIFAVLKIVMTLLAQVSWLGLSSPVSDPVKLWTLGGPAGDVLLIALYLALTLALSKVTFERVEAPARAWFARLADRVDGNGRHTLPGSRGLATRS